MPKFAFSLAIFLALVLYFGQFASLVQDRYEYPLHSWSWWTVRELREIAAQKRVCNFSPNGKSLAPNTVLLGSSLMVVANAECDATWKQERIDLTTYRKARYFDAAMSKKVRASGDWEETVSANLSAPGQIPSDAFLTLQEALNEGISPSLVVYGVAPRDFVDSTMSSPFETEGYKYLSRLVPTNAVDSKIREGVIESFGRHIVASVPLSRNAIDLQMAFTKLVSGIKDRVFGRGIETISLEKRMSLISTYKPLDMVPGFIHAEIARKEDVDKLYSDNLSDYKARYARPKADFYDGQLACFEELVRFCKDNYIELVVVNMPVRQCNLDLLDSGMHSKYLADVSRVSTEYGARFIDLCETDRYVKQDYRDSVHLNGFGGRKFLNQLVGEIASKPLRRQVPAVAAQGNLESPL